MGNEVKNIFEVSDTCRISGSSNLVDVLYLGEQPLANSLKENLSDNEIKVPLTLAFCPESSLAQIKETVNKEILFSHYVWVSGTAFATREYADKLCRQIIDIACLDKKDLIIEVASNDGTFLKPFINAGFKNVLGVDPARNIADMANAKGIRTIAKFWNKKLSEEIGSEYGKAKVIMARNVIPHVSELIDVMAGIGSLLSDDGVGAIEFHYAYEILEGLQYDSIYHEHLCYFSIVSIKYLLKSLNLNLFHAVLSPISGGALVVYFSKKARKTSDFLAKLIQNEKDKKINTLERWKDFAQKCLKHREKSLDIISTFSNKTIVAFGASARSSTYLNFCGFDSTRIQAIIDNNTLKQGMYSPGTSIPIVSLERGMQMNPDLIFILAWNFRDEIVNECLMNGYKGEFLVAFPNSPYYFKG